MKTTHKCPTCDRILTEQELDRYEAEFENWARKHPNWETQIDARDTSLIYRASGVQMDCDECAIERLQEQEDDLESQTFLQRVAAGGSKGFWLVAVAILGLLVLYMAR